MTIATPTRVWIEHVDPVPVIAPAGAFSSLSFGDAPVIDADFADPDILQSGGTYYAYGTSTRIDGRNRSVQVAESSDLVTWSTIDTDALASLPAWTTGRRGAVWAPEVAEVAPGQFRMYYTSASRGGPMCIGLATSTSPVGPFTPVGDAPLVCPRELGGAIDAATFRDDDGTLFLLWKTDGNSIGLPTWIQIAAMNDDGSALAGPTSTLLGSGLDWEHGNIEGPTLLERDGVYQLFYSAYDYSVDGYAIGHATATSLGGPFVKDCAPVLSAESGLGLHGPGGQDVLTDDAGATVMAFASWDAGHRYRAMHVLPLDWQGTHPIVPDVVPGPEAPAATSDCSADTGIVAAAQ